MACVSNHVLLPAPTAASVTSARDLASMVQVTPAPGQDNGVRRVSAEGLESASASWHLYKGGGGHLLI